MLSAAAIFFYGAAVLDLRARAKSAWLTAERYGQWQNRPELKKEYFEKIYQKKSIALKNSGIPPEKLEKELAGLETEKNFIVNESSAKYAYLWYKTAATSFCRPRNKWCERAREKLAPAKESWKAEMRSKKIKFEEWMID
ncbi:MAG: hypothetical protein NTX59_13075 [Elusimicrobia bacterium]|nr:hypothetical protein [Elusimicrobiota bacterium]